MKASEGKLSKSSLASLKNSIHQTLFLFIIIVISIQCSQPKEWVEIYENGMLIEKYQHSGDSIPDGSFEGYDEQGQLFEQSHYLKGELHGEKRFFYSNGKVQSLETLKNGQYHGPYMLFDSTGQILQESYYENDKTLGVLKNYYSNGQLKEEVLFTSGLENGPFVEYYKNGKLKAEGTYRDGDTENGLLKLYDTTGVLIRKMNCEMGICRTIWVDEKIEDENK